MNVPQNKPTSYLITHSTGKPTGPLSPPTASNQTVSMSGQPEITYLKKFPTRKRPKQTLGLGEKDSERDSEGDRRYVSDKSYN